MTKDTKNGSVNFHANVRTWIPPTISDQFVDDEGILQFCLSNGNTMPADKYNQLWNPPKGQINWAAKGNGIDSRTNWIK